MPRIHNTLPWSFLLAGILLFSACSTPNPLFALLASPTPTPTTTSTPTVTPTPTFTPTSTPTPYPLQARPYQPDEASPTPLFLLEAWAGYRGLKEPGTRTYEVRLPGGTAWMYDTTWCTTTRDLLEDNRAKINWRFYWEGQPIKIPFAERIRSYQKWERACLFREAVLQFPTVPEETTVTLEEVWDFAEDVDDGWNVYPAGEYRHVYKLTLLPENPLVSESTDCRRTWTEVLDKVTPVICQPSEPLWAWWRNRKEEHEDWEGNLLLRENRLVIRATGRETFGELLPLPIAPTSHFFFGFTFLQMQGSYQGGNFAGIYLWNPRTDARVRFHLHTIVRTRGGRRQPAGGWHVDFWFPNQKPQLLQRGFTDDPGDLAVPISVLSDGQTLRFFIKHHEVFQMERQGPWRVYVHFGGSEGRQLIYILSKLFFALPQAQP